MDNFVTIFEKRQFLKKSLVKKLEGYKRKAVFWKDKFPNWNHPVENSPEVSIAELIQRFQFSLRVVMEALDDSDKSELVLDEEFPSVFDEVEAELKYG